VDPNRVWKAPWRWYNERMLDCCVPLSVVKTSGITVDQFACLAACNTLDVRIHRADSHITEQHFRDVIMSTTRRTDQVIVASYGRKALQQTGDGHFSSIGGYNPERDLVLLMDTARFKYPPHWVSLSLLFTAMQQIDSNTGLPRGYLILRKSHMPTALLFHLSPNIGPMKSDKASTFSTFVDAWELWLHEVVKSNAEHVADEAIEELIRLLGTNDDFPLIATRKGATEEELVEERIEKEYREDTNELLQSLQGLSLYQNACHIYKQKFPGSSIKVIHADDMQSSHIPSLSSRSPELSGNSSYKESTLNRDNKHQVSLAHFVTILALSWPYHRCNGGNRAVAMRMHVETTLSQRSAKLLEMEARRLRQQLTSILNYTKNNSAK